MDYSTSVATESGLSVYLLSDYLESACGLVEQCRTPGRYTVSSSPASDSVFVSLGKILSLNCFVDLSVIR